MDLLKEVSPDFMKEHEPPPALDKDTFWVQHFSTFRFSEFGNTERGGNRDGN